MPDEQPRQLIPRDYVRIALSPLSHSTGEAFYNRKIRKFIFRIDEQILFGPITHEQMEALLHVANDVREMRGRYGAV